MGRDSGGTGALGRAAGRLPAVPLILGGILAWSYWPVLRSMAHRWSKDPHYNHGFLIPAFAASLLWLRRDRLDGAGRRSTWGGLALIVAGSAARLLGTYIYFDWLEAASLLPCLAGVFVLAGGRAALRWSWPAVAFLVFMIPLPFRVEMFMGWPLQRAATVASTFALQTLGFPAIGEGNIIAIDETRIGVVEACNGLGMMLLFFALASGVAALSRRPALDRALIIASAAPIALAANIARITVTGVLHETVGGRIADLVYHELAGWLMTPLALALLGAELGVLSLLLVEDDPTRRAPAASGPTTRDDSHGSIDRWRRAAGGTSRGAARTEVPPPPSPRGAS